MTDEQRKRIREILYSTDSREELAERIVALEDERNKLRELLAKREYDIERMRELVSRSQTDLEVEFDFAERMEDKEEMYRTENSKLRELAEKYVRRAYALACEKSNPITRGIIAEDARGLGIEVEDA